MAKGVKPFYTPERHKALRPIPREEPTYEQKLETLDLAAEARFKPQAPQMRPAPGVSVPEVSGVRIGAPTKGAPFNPTPNADGAKLPNGRPWV